MMAIDANTISKPLDDQFKLMEYSTRCSQDSEKKAGLPLSTHVASRWRPVLAVPVSGFPDSSSHTILACSSADRARFIFVGVRMSVMSVRCQRYTPSASTLARVSHCLVPPGVLHSCPPLPLRFISG